jgi:hypothetical protein
MVPYVKGSVAKEQTSIFPFASRCHIGFWSDTLPLVKSRNTTALARRGPLPSYLAAPVKSGGESKQMEATIPPIRLVPVGPEAKHNGGGSNCDA